jgi:hypothetical protein
MRNITRLLFALVMFCIYSFSAFGQSTSVEKNFQANLKEYSMEHFVEGEDATSGYDYLFYKSGPKIVKIRTIWSSSTNRPLRVEDLFFDTGLAVVKKSTASKKYLRTLVKGRTAPITTVGEFFFTEGKLVRWVIKGVEVPRSDPRWSQTEKDILEQAKSEMEQYDWLKAGK